MPFSVCVANDRKSLGHRPVDPCLSRRVSQGHPAGVPGIFLSLCALFFPDLLPPYRIFDLLPIPKFTLHSIFSPGGSLGWPGRRSLGAGSQSLEKVSGVQRPWFPKDRKRGSGEVLSGVGVDGVGEIFPLLFFLGFLCLLGRFLLFFLCFSLLFFACLHFSSFSLILLGGGLHQTTTKFLINKIGKISKFYCHGISQGKKKKKHCFGTIFRQFFPSPTLPGKQILVMLSFWRLRWGTRANDRNLLQKWEFHSDLICTDPAQNFPTFVGNEKGT